jgi:putative DNA modification/repair radical SAM protein
MDLEEKLRILTGAAKYDVACTSSGVSRGGKKGNTGNATAWGICHSFASDGRCISLLKILMSNACSYDCSYCINRRTNETPRATLTPRELAELTIQFYRRNYIEGLFLSSGVLRNPDYTCEQMIAALRLLREEYAFNGYIHAKAIPGTDSRLIRELGLLADRMSVNIELPSSSSLRLLAPNKTKDQILKPMRQIKEGIAESKTDLVRYKSVQKLFRADRPHSSSSARLLKQTSKSSRFLNRCTGSIPSSGFSTQHMFRLFIRPIFPPSTPSRRFCANTDCVKRIFSCVSTVFQQASCFPKKRRILTLPSIPNATGP